MDIGKHISKNHRKLDALANQEYEWAVALEKCQEHIRIRLKRRTTFGAHTEARLGEDPYTYYISYAYDSILSGRWEWKDGHSLSEQMILIADSTISTEVEKSQTKKPGINKVMYDDLETMFYLQDFLPDESNMVTDILIDRQISIIEESIQGDEKLEYFWECVKEGMKRAEIAANMEITLKQQDKLRERFINTIRKSSYFEMN